MAAELRLGVSFDLVYFRQQLGKLSQIAASEFVGKVRLNIDKRDFQRQFAGLTKELRINVNDSQIIGARENLGKLNRSLATFRRAVAAPIEIKVKYTEQGRPPAGFGGTASRVVSGRVAGAQAIEGTSRAELQKLYGLFREANLRVGQLSKGLRNSTEQELRDALIPAFSDSGEEAVNGLANGLKDGSSKVGKAAAKLGEDTLRSIKDVLGIASPSREFKKVGEDSGEGLEQGLKTGIGEAARVGVQEIRSLFRALQGEAQAGTARLQAMMIGAMAGVVQLPGGRQQRGRLMQTGAGINAAMTGPAVGNIQARQSAIRNASQGAAATTPAFAAALPLMFGMDPRELTARLQGLYGQQYRAPSMGGYQAARPGRVASLIEALSSTRGNLSPAAGVNQRLFTGGAVNPGVLSSGYIGRSAISPGFVNYPAGMPPAYATGFIEPSAFGSLAAGTVGRYGMASSRPGFPLSPMMTGGFGAGGGSFVPVEAGRNVNSFQQSLTGLTERVQSAAGAVRSVLMPTFGDMRKQVIDMNRSIAVAQNSQNSMFYGKYMTPHGNMGMYDFPTAGMMGPSSPVGSMGRFPSAGMMYPSSPLGVINAQSSMFGGGGAGGGGGLRGGGAAGGPGGPGGPGSHNIVQFGRSIQGIMGPLQTARVPLSGAINELGSEFGTAVKQVLLFGTAYKALAFITSLPGQAFEAAKGLQTFRNQLDAVTSVTGTFEQSFQFIDTLAERFNVPLESARQGFVKMFASMQPAGFSQQEIEGLFTGVSQAAAAFGMSSDQVERVTNAFSQMASKGQIMSEELKGQLGDVLPGALSIFAEAAGMTIPEFSQAMEDGAFKGKAMQDVLNNVAVVFSNKFGPAAQNASKTLQGALNAINNDLLKMYESFGPLVDQMAATFGPQITKLIEDVTSVMKVLTGTFTDAGEGVDTLSPRAQELYNTIQQLIPTFRDAGKAVVELGQFFARLVPIAVQLGNILLQVASSNVGKAFITVSLSVGLLQTAFVGLTRAGIMPAIAAIYRFIGTQLASVLVGLHRQFITLTQGVVGFTAAARASRIALIALRTALTGLVVGGILLGLEAIGTMLFSIGDEASKSASKVRQLKIDLDRMAGAGDTLSIAAELETAKAAEKAAMTRLNRAQAAADMPAAQQAMLGPEAQLSIQRELQNAQNAYNQAQQSRVDAQKSLENAERIRQSQEQEQKKLTPITPSPEGEDGKKKKERESQIPELQERLRLAKELLDVDRRITEARLSGNDLAVGRIEYEREMLEIASKVRMVKLEDIPDAEKALKIEELRIESQLAFEKMQANVRKTVLEDLQKQSDALEEIQVASSQELANTKRYEDLLRSGVNPALAKATIEVENKFAAIQKEFDLKTQQMELEIAELEAMEKRTAEQEKYLALLRLQLKLRGDAATGIPESQAEEQARQQQLLQPKSNAVIAIEAFDEAKTRLAELTNPVNALITAAQGIGDAFSQSFSDIITGAVSVQAGLGDLFKNIGKMFIDMAMQMIAQYMVMKAIGLIANFFGGGANMGGGSYFDPLTGKGVAGPNFGLANGGVINGSFMPITPFANGGMVTGPTLGLVGEGRFNEAVVPLPDGRSIPVELGQGAGNNIATNITVNVSNGQAQSTMSGRGGSALGRELDAAVKDVILRETRPGGIIYSAR